MPSSPGAPFLSPSQWWSGLRPKTLPLALMPVVLGGALAWRVTGGIDGLLLLVTGLTALLIQAGTNLFNDAKDGIRGNDGPDRSGPTRLTASGQASARQVLNSAWLLFGLALVGGLYLVWRGGTGILVLGLCALAAGWTYSGGPRPLSHTAWGEVFVIAFFGVAAVGGTYYLQVGALSPAAALLGLALGAQAAAVLIVNNLRDVEADTRAGRRTLAGVLGPVAGRVMYAVFMMLPFPLAALALRGLTAGGVEPFWAALPFAALLVWRFPPYSDGTAMNRQLALTALAQVLLAALLALTLLLPVD